MANSLPPVMRSLAALVLSLALLTGCGGDDDGSRGRFGKKDTSGAVDGGGDTLVGPGDVGPGEGLPDGTRPDGAPEAVDPREGVGPEPVEGTSWEPWPEPRPDGVTEAPGPETLEPWPEPGPEPAPEPTPEPVWEPVPEPSPEIVEVQVEVAPTPVTVHELQTSADSVACTGADEPYLVRPNVRLSGVVVTAPRYTASYTGDGLDGYYVADGSAAAAYRGLLVVVPATLGTAFPVGARLDVVGDYKEYYCMSEVLATSISQIGTASTPQPLAVSGAQVAWASPDSEPLEGVLVRLAGGVITALDDYGEVVVDGQWRLANEFDLPYLQADGDRAVGDVVVSATGVVEYSFGKYLVNPRSPADLVIQPL